MQKNKQTKRLLEDGGMLQEGGTVDEVSGNKVPVGAMKEEVRDDVPAQLSEGEFVFPADVVRFIGLERLMKMRQAAKEGLMKMEDMGQMSNGEDGTEEEDTSEFESDVDEIMGEMEIEKETGEGKEEEGEGKKEMATGGSVTAQTSTLLKKKSSESVETPGLSNEDIVRIHTERNTPGTTLTQAISGLKKVVDAGAKVVRINDTLIAAKGDPETKNTMLYIMNGGDAKQYIRSIKAVVQGLREAKQATATMFISDQESARKISKAAGVNYVTFKEYPNRTNDKFLMTMEL